MTGIIPSFLVRKEHALTNAQELLVVENMHERKQAMFDRADAFVALPGGIGTLEELVEQMTWAQLDRHEKPILIADVEGFWRPLLALFAHMNTAGLHPARLRIALQRGGEDRGHRADAARSGREALRPRTRDRVRPEHVTESGARGGCDNPPRADAPHFPYCERSADGRPGRGGALERENWEALFDDEKMDLDDGARRGGARKPGRRKRGSGSDRRAGGPGGCAATATAPAAAAPAPKKPRGKRSAGASQ